MPLSRDRPEILTPPPHPPARCTQQTITVGPQAAAKTRQKHHYPSPQWPRSYRRPTAAERVNATIKDTATTTIARGWCRLTGLAPLTLWTACLLAVRTRILTAWDARQQDHARRAAAGLPPRTRKRRRTSLAQLAAGPQPPAPPAPSRHQQPQQARQHQGSRAPTPVNPAPIMPAGEPRNSPAARTAKSSGLTAECQTQM
jgi:hypothetical protein